MTRAAGSRVGSADVATTCTAIEAYLDRLLGADLDIRATRLKPEKPAAIAAAATKLATTFPPDLVAFLRRGLRSPSGIIGDGDACIGFDFLSAAKIVRDTAALRAIAAETDAPAAHAALIRRGIVVSFEEPMLVVADDGVYHFSFRNPLLRVAASWREFLAHWLASGCFASQSFDAGWKQLAPYVDAAIPPTKNLWVRAYKRQFPG